MFLITAQFGAAQWGAAQWAGEIEIIEEFTTVLLDGFTFSDSVQTQLLPIVLSAHLSDSLLFSDSLIAILLPVILSKLLIDKLEFFDLIEDTFFAAARFQHLVDFPYKFLDSVNTQVTGTPMGMSDFFNFSDSIKQQLNIFAEVSDSIVISDSVIAVSSDKSPVLTDSLSFSDHVQTQLSVQLSTQISDTIVISDSLNQVPSTSFNSYIRRYLNDVV